MPPNTTHFATQYHPKRHPIPPIFNFLLVLLVLLDLLDLLDNKNYKTPPNTTRF